MTLAAIDAKTRLLAVLGDPIGHSLSPTLHNLALELLATAGINLNFRYLAFQVAPSRLADTVRGLAAMGAAGFNATIPHKEALVPLMDQLTAEARCVGAVNTVIIDNRGQLTGHNTDIHGFTTAARQAFPPQPADEEGTAILLGAGGAARAVLAGLPQLGVKRIVIINRHVERATLLLEQLSPSLNGIHVTVAPWEDIHPYLPACQWLVNTTSVGLGADSPQMANVRQELHQLPKTAKIMDIVYGPQPTPLLQKATSLGLACTDGLAMLVHQGAAAFRLWTGHEMPTRPILDTLRKRIQSQ